MAKPTAALLGAGAILFLLSRKEEKEKEKEDAKPSSIYEKDAGCTCADLLNAWMSPAGQPLIGRLYQAQRGDNHLLIARKALFGTSEPRVDPKERDAVIELSIRIDCSPWNQTVYGKPASMLAPGHYAVERGYTNKGIHYMPVFPDNYKRLSQGEPPLVGSGDSFPLIWIPKIDLHKFMQFGIITTEGQDYPDDGQGSYNMIDPPPWIIDLQFEGDLEPGMVGCPLPEGDFRKEITLDEDE